MNGGSIKGVEAGASGSDGLARRRRVKEHHGREIEIAVQQNTESVFELHQSTSACCTVLHE